MIAMMNSLNLMPRCALSIAACGMLAATLGFGAVPAYAAGAASISYDGARDELAVTGASGAVGSTDLFAAFKNVLPGDTLVQEVDIDFTNVSAPARLYIQADTANLTAEQRAALEQMTLSAAFDGTGIVAEDTAAQPQAVFAADAPVPVAQVEGNASATMRLTLQLPTSLGNELMTLGDVHLPWIITVEEEDGTGGTTDPEPTGPQNPEPGNPGDDGPATPGGTGTPSGPSGSGPAGGAGATTDDGDGDRGLLETIGDLLTGNDRDEAPEEELADDKTPLEGPAAHARACWVHWVILVGMAVSLVYYAAVALRRNAFARSLASYEDRVLEEARNRLWARKW